MLKQRNIAFKNSVKILLEKEYNYGKNYKKIF